MSACIISPSQLPIERDWIHFIVREPNGIRIEFAVDTRGRI